MIVCLGTTPALARTMEFAGLTIDGVNRATRVYEYAAGKAVNAARAAAILGEAVVCLSPAGGATGERLRAMAERSGVEHRFVEVGAATRLTVTVVDRERRQSTELIEPSGSLTAIEGEALLDALAACVDAASVVVLSGSLAPGLATDFYARAVHGVRAAGGVVILDASAEALKAAIEERPDVVKINAEELASVEPIASSDVIAAALAFASRTSGWVIVTRGRRPTLAVHADGSSLTVEVPNVEVVSPIGSGDSFAGGLAAGLIREMTIEESLSLATACASANVGTADAAHFDRVAVDALIPQVRVTPSA